MKKRIDFEHDAIVAAEHWHGGMTSMLYALSSSGYLGTGTIRPRGCDGPLSDDEWIAMLADNLESEAQSALDDCNLTRERSSASEHDELYEDEDGLRSILTTIKEWRASQVKT
jgi:hypothetical protein